MANAVVGRRLDRQAKDAEIIALVVAVRALLDSCVVDHNAFEDAKKQHTDTVLDGVPEDRRRDVELVLLGYEAPWRHPRESEGE